ncbi:hypothetical protein [Rufibacter tibetensis]|uniref:Uncharacterized protein n=1 Tax=Rufibacter tibetensis TaxID=512763 RepID=A0A0P0CPL5_9BACT|nr:hypothetical protein [Rufibacter tibetensis]ALI99238.1 hypothetical protein DC20_09930 [Rufibacter tibetensis]
MQQHLTIFDPFEGMRFGNHICFLCGTRVTADQQTPVFPAWLMEKYSLGHEPLRLLDQSVVTYQDLKIPCCAQCQTQYLGPLEEKVQEAVSKGVPGLRAIDEKLLFQWMGKMFYGTLITELIKEQNPLVRPEYAVSEQPKMLLKFQSFFRVLQSLRVPMVFPDFIPASIFVIDVDASAEPSQFEFRDELSTMMFSLRLDNALIVCCLLDNGMIKDSMRRVWQVVEPRQLQPIQAAELSARIFYAGYLLNVIPDYLVRPVKPQDEHLVMDTLIDDVTNVIFNPWQHSSYAKLLATMWAKWGITQEDILRDPQEPLSMLFSPEGEFIEFPTIPGQAK